MGGNQESLQRNRLMFSLQSGSPACLQKADIIKAFSRLGDIHHLSYRTGFTFGWVKFKSNYASIQADNLQIPITTSTGQWMLHTFQDFSMTEPFKEAFSHQILLESRDLPTSWERFIIIKEFFKKFGEITGVMNLGTTRHRVQRIVVSFKKSCVAQGLVNTYQRILSSSMEVKAISADTLKTAHITFNR